jgi:hypothetical protein
VSVYADGPTRVLRFSDDKNVSSLEAQNVVLDLAARLRQVEAALRQVNAHFARLNGVGGAHTLDLYGRTTAARPAAAAAQPAAARKAGKRLPLREATRELIRQAHSKRPAGGDSTGGPASPARRDSLEGGSLPPSAAPSLPASRTPSFTVGARAAQGVLGLPGGALSRQATVRFDMGPAQQQGPPGVPRPASAAAAPPGVLRIPEQREERLLPYRRLMVRTGSEPGEPSSLAAADEGGQGSQRSPGFLLQRQASAGEIQEEAAGAPAAAEAPAEARRGGHTTLRMSASGRDWGHITPSSEQHLLYGCTAAPHAPCHMPAASSSAAARSAPACPEPWLEPPSAPHRLCLQPTRRPALGAWLPARPRLGWHAATAAWPAATRCVGARKCCAASPLATPCCCWAETSR